MASDLANVNTSRWNNMHISTPMSNTFKQVADRITSNKKRYQAVSDKTGVPWEVIGVIHEREASGKWDTYLGNGQPLSRKTTKVPAGRGPFASWEEGAIDALKNCGSKPATNTDWSIGGTLTELEQYNGLGYANRGVPSPYIWSGTDQYSKGKYTGDHVYDPNAVDQQLGCAGLLRFMGYGVTHPSTGPLVAAGATAAGATALGTTMAHHNLPAFIAFAVAAVVTVFIVYAIHSYKHEDRQLGQTEANVAKS